MMGETVEQRGGHLGVAEDGGPFAEGEVGGDDDRSALVEPAHEVEEQLPAGLSEGQVAEFVEDDEVAADELVCEIGVREGLCRPDVLLTVTRPGGPAPRVPGGPFDDSDKVRYVIEVMGSDDAQYERKKEKTHRRMKRLGRVIRLEGWQFGSAHYGLERQLERVAFRIANDLVRRWGGS